jgi:hypothetical protein
MSITFTFNLWMAVPAVVTALFVAGLLRAVLTDNFDRDLMGLAAIGWLCTAGLSILTGVLA